MPVVSYGKPCLMVNHISMQKYLEGLLQVEMISSWPLAALQAQAVAARTYALSAIRETKRQRASNFPFDIGSTVEDQVFKGWRGDVPRIKKAVQTTRGKALFMAGRLNPTFYHSTCGGYTERPKDVWGESIRGYERRPCPYCLGSPVFEWSINVRSKKLEKLVKDSSRRLASNSGISQFFVSHRSEGGRVKEVGLRLNKHIETLQSEDFRKKVGRSFLKSSWFQVKGVQSRGERLLSVHLNGRGFGHGVGMCQWGARRLARMGKDFKEILKHYYPKGSLVRLY
jgi:stage II sporulation protein D